MAGSGAFELNRKVSTNVTPMAKAAGPRASMRASRRGQAGRLRPSQVPVPSATPAWVPRDLAPGQGQPLMTPLKEEMEGRLGADFSDVRVHSGPAARSAAEQLDARAYTLGSHVVIGDGGADKDTMAHELAHVIQQRTGAVGETGHGGGLRLGDPSSPFERAADSAAARAMSLSAPPTQPARTAWPEGASHAVSPPVIQRKGRREVMRDGAPVIKVILAGSGYERWLTHEAKKAQWKRADKENDKNVPTYYSRDKKDDVGSGQELFTAQVSFAGPGAANTKDLPYFSGGGVRDVGSNKIEELVQKVPSIVQKLVTAIEGEYSTGPVILIKAHSRGAVAASRIADRLRTDFPRTTIELVQFDPVPGPNTAAANKKITLPEDIESTIVYSVASGYEAGFSPQEVLGARRIIISQQNHSAGLAAGFRYNNEVYKGSRLNSLPRGVYVDFNANGENSVPLKLVASKEEAMQKFDEALEKSKKTSDLGRKNTVESVLKEYFRNA